MKFLNDFPEKDLSRNIKTVSFGCQDGFFLGLCVQMMTNTRVFFLGPGCPNVA